jgi:hypothetical protein
VIDAVLDYDPGRGRTSTTAADVTVVETRGLSVDWVLETHAHADHLSAAAYLKERLGGRLGIGAHIRDIQEYWRRLYNAVGAIPPDGSQFDRLFEEGDVIEVGAMSGTVWHTPGHTACDVTYLFGDAAFVGDTLFMPDYGMARADFPGGEPHVPDREDRPAKGHWHNPRDREGRTMVDRLEEKIQWRAYQIWERDGHPEGKQNEYWTRACQEIAAETGVEMDCTRRPVAFCAEDAETAGDNRSARVRSAGPDGMRDAPRRLWDKTDQSSDESFPASGPPAY